MATRTIIFVSVLLLGTCLAKRRSEQRMSDEEYNRLFPDDCDSCKGNNVLLPECNVCNKITLLTQDTVFFNSSADVSWRNAPETAGFEKVETVEEGSKEEADMSIMSGTKKEFWEGYGTEGYSCRSLGPKPAHITDAISLQAIGGLESSKKDQVEGFMRIAKRYGNQVKLVLIGDSITRHLQYDLSCLQKIYSPYELKGLNFGVSGMEADFLGSMTNWLFKNSKIAPQTVWVAAGINNCFRSQGYKSAEAANQIFDIVRLVKFYSPQTRVVIQGVLPTSYPYPESEQYAGMYWNDTNTFPMHHCVKDINKRLRKFVKEYRDHCVEYADLDNVVISDGGQFKSGVLGDGLHFRPEPADMNSYCEAIARAVEPFNNGWVRARSEGQYVEDVEPLYFEGLEGPIYYRWKYGEWSPCTGTCGEQRRSAHCYRMEAGDLGSEAVDDTFCQDVFLNPLQRVCDFSKDCLSVFNVVKESLVQLPGSMVLNTDFNQRATEPVREPCPVAQVLDNRISMGLVAGVAVVAVCLLAALLIALHNWRLLKYAVEESKVTTAERDIIRRKYPMGL